MNSGSAAARLMSAPKIGVGPCIASIGDGYLVRRSTDNPSGDVLTPVVRILLFANVGAYFLQVTQPALANALVFYPPAIFVRPWTAITYMFIRSEAYTSELQSPCNH